MSAIIIILEMTNRRLVSKTMYATTITATTTKTGYGNEMARSGEKSKEKKRRACRCKSP
jgi:hypothetical protein